MVPSTNMGDPVFVLVIEGMISFHGARDELHTHRDVASAPYLTKPGSIINTKTSQCTG